MHITFTLPTMEHIIHAYKKNKIIKHQQQF